MLKSYKIGVIIFFSLKYRVRDRVVKKVDFVFVFSISN